MTSDLCVGERPFKCESCNYLAANQHEVTRHARQVHNGPKPLACPYCEYKTADRSNFKKHVELHLNPRQFLCPLCKYAASKKCNLQYHIKSRHAGCNVTLDVSKVKLRVKKADGAEETSANKLETSSSAGEDVDAEDGDELQGAINLSVKSGNAHRKSNAVPEKVSKEDKKGQRKMERKSEPKSDHKSKRRVKKTAADEPQISPAPVEESAESTESKSLNKTRRSGPKKAGQLDGPQAGKRRAAEALDLSTKCPPETPVKVRRLKTGAGEKEETTPLSVKKTRKSNRKSPSPEPDSSAPSATAGLHHEPPSQTAPPLPTTPQHITDQPTEALGQDTPIPMEDSPPPALAKPSSPPSPRTHSQKEVEAEEDEGIHSSHEGGSDISDSASEGSDDSGLNGNAAASGKMANDPETPTDEIPTPTELKSHMCIFCDRTFPLEAEYRRHLNRHLVNVYYMDATPGH